MVGYSPSHELYVGPVSWTELCWAAGFVDGEGHIDSRRLIVIKQVERAPLERMQRALGGSITGPWPNNRAWNSQPIWMWSSSGRDAAWLLANLVPLMADGKKKAEAVERMSRPWGVGRNRWNQRIVSGIQDA